MESMRGEETKDSEEKGELAFPIKALHMSISQNMRVFLTRFIANLYILVCYNV